MDKPTPNQITIGESRAGKVTILEGGIEELGAGHAGGLERNALEHTIPGDAFEVAVGQVCILKLAILEFAAAEIGTSEIRQLGVLRLAETPDQLVLQVGGDPHETVQAGLGQLFSFNLDWFIVHKCFAKSGGNLIRAYPIRWPWNKSKELGWKNMNFCVNTNGALTCRPGSLV